ncbi:MAG: di-trans,poly-cis-decaprenylcistransferase [Bacteroidetes bacterium GWC2_33_15]|nr:MAG: di-trans,poly-cis-decaprenylcistransferase [Bacteroidetes bacterium GWA2_33_15]OFX51677.1 MAG: di-trans,poly-cis-decaprenylcistransferase [Bacteroidetes bacterium GWC2_33_15]OFX66261.1 MAG: di-trans,poly-cis-decaprenylcistransferase [Bacteroidetes bacterium GWB2_32_14]OFX66977.1 MAG: di-trans,poly-cis-decaprenylcistransferase [Bacteroidetes bacterium GWD2_33_33]HAN17675.1 isoprenyl transferase [Bacteroidales bacterium]
MSAKDKIDRTKLPKHIAIIMDGNGRWAQKKGNQRIFGHQNAVKAVRETVEGAGEIGVEFLTLYTFSTENWNRPKNEVDALMSLLVATINSESGTLLQNNVRLKTIGDIDGLPKDVKKNLLELIQKTEKNTGLTLILALNYSARWEIVNAVKNIVSKSKTSELEVDEIDNAFFEKYLNTYGIPDPDLLIRTSGEYRISNFLIWQIAYTELFFTPVLWPDFRKDDLYNAIVDYQNRERRFGKTSDQLKDS